MQDWHRQGQGIDNHTGWRHSTTGLGIDCLFVGTDCLCGLGSRSEPHTGGADHRRDRPTAPQPPAIASVEMSPNDRSRRRSRRSAPPSRRRSGKSTSPSRRSSRSTHTNSPLSGQLSRWAECLNVAPPRKRNRENIEAAFKDFKQRFHHSPVQHEPWTPPPRRRLTSLLT